MKLTNEQLDAVYEARRGVVTLRAAIASDGDPLPAAKALWSDVAALIHALDPTWDVRHALVASKLDTLATTITADIETDASDRRLFDDVDPDIREEIVRAWREIVLKKLKEAT